MNNRKYTFEFLNNQTVIEAKISDHSPVIKGPTRRT